MADNPADQGDRDEPADKTTGAGSVDEGHTPSGEHRSPLQALDNGAGTSESSKGWGDFRMLKVSTAPKRPRSMSGDESDWESDFDSSDDENWSGLSSRDSDAESHRSAKPMRCRDKVKTGLVSDDGYQRFDPLASEEEDSWRLPADLASYLKRQAGKELDKGHKKALKQEAPAPKKQALQP